MRRSRRARSIMEAIIFMLVLTCTLFPPLASSVPDRITPAWLLKDGESIVSPGQFFELGFFSPKKDSKTRYLGIWYKKIAQTTVVWVANRETPLNDSSGVLKLSPQGTLSIENGLQRTIWSSNNSNPKISPVAMVLDTGNLVVRINDDDDEDPESYLWQSFDYPGNTLLPGMKYGFNFRTGLNRGLRSWAGEDDPSNGDYTNEMNPRGLPEFLLKKGNATRFRTGPWNGLRFSGMPNLKPNQIK